MKCYVLAEGERDTALLQALLREEINTSPNDILVQAAGGWSAADSLARTLLATDSDAAVAVFVDADDRDADKAEKRRRFLHQSLFEYGEPSRWHVTVIRPEIEALYFRSKAVLHDLLDGEELSSAEEVKSEFAPRQVLEARLGSPASLNRSHSIWSRTLINRLSQIDVSPLRNEPEIRELLRFLQNVTSRENHMAAIPTVNAAG